MSALCPLDNYSTKHFHQRLFYLTAPLIICYLFYPVILIFVRLANFVKSLMLIFVPELLVLLLLLMLLHPLMLLLIVIKPVLLLPPLQPPMMLPLSQLFVLLHQLFHYQLDLLDHDRLWDHAVLVYLVVLEFLEFLVDPHLLHLLQLQ